MILKYLLNTSPWLYLAALLVIIPAHGQVLWSEDNCNTAGVDENVVYGLPTDAICCNGTVIEGTYSNFCLSLPTEVMLIHSIYRCYDRRLRMLG